MPLVQVDQDELHQLIKQNQEIKADVIALNATLAPVFSFVGSSSPIRALTKAIVRFSKHPEEIQELGANVSSFIRKYSPEVLENINKKTEPSDGR